MIRASFLMIATTVFFIGNSAEAGPITFAFTGNLPDPLNGVNSFSGSFTINGDSRPSGSYPYSSVNQGGSDASITVNMGGQVYHFDNEHGPHTTALFETGPSPTWIRQDQSGSPQAETMIYGNTSSTDGKSPGASFGMTFYTPTPLDLANLQGLSLPPGSGSVYVVTTSPGGLGYAASGTVTSTWLVPTPTPTPEPSTLAVFATLGFAAMAYVRRSRPR